MFFKSKTRPLIGLDITTSSIKLIEISMSGGQYCVESFAVEPTPANSMTEKAIIDPVVIGEAIKRVVRRSGTRCKEAAVAISGEAAITKIIQMPGNLSEVELEDQVDLQADQYIPYPMEEVSYDFEVIGPSVKEPQMNDVLLVATRTENVSQRVSACELGGLQAKVVDVEPFALEKSCRLMTHQMPAGGIGQVVAVVDFGASSTTFSVLSDLRVIYTRSFAFGGQQLTEEIMRTYGLSMEDAGRGKKEGGLPANYQSDVLDPFIDDMYQQVARSMQFYLASGTARVRPSMILICGGCANIPGVAELISSRLGIPAERGNPLGAMKLGVRARNQNVINKESAAMLTACGLALRSFD